MRPRHEPSFARGGNRIFIGYVGPFDVYHEDVEELSAPLAFVVGPRERELILDRPHNYDVFDILGGALSQREPRDLHIELHEMCAIMELLVEKGYLNDTSVDSTRTE